MPQYKGIDNAPLNFDQYLKIFLMDKISQYGTSVNHFIYAKKIDSCQSFEFQRYDTDTMSKMIFELLNDDFCEVFCWDNEHKINITNQAIEYYNKNQCFDFDSNDNIELSKKGVLCWENYFKPNWDYYVDIYFDDRDYQNPVNVEITSMNQNLLNDIFKKLLKNKIKIEMLDEWEICDWKTINNQPIFKYSYIAKTLKEKIAVDEIWRDLSDYYRDKFCPKSRHFY